jgi:hypothetical protein
MFLMSASQKGKPNSSKPHNLWKGMTSSWAWIITCFICLSFNVLVIVLIAYHSHGLLEEVGVYNGEAIKDALDKLDIPVPRDNNLE